MGEREAGRHAYLEKILICEIESYEFHIKTCIIQIVVDFKK